MKQFFNFICFGAGMTVMALLLLVMLPGCSSSTRATTDAIVNAIAQPAMQLTTFSLLKKAGKKSPDTAKKAAELMVADLQTALSNPIVQSVLAGKISIPVFPTAGSGLSPSEIDSLTKVVDGITDGAQEYLDSLGGKVNDAYRVRKFDPDWLEGYGGGLYCGGDGGYLSRYGYGIRAYTIPCCVRGDVCMQAVPTVSVCSTDRVAEDSCAESATSVWYSQGQTGRVIRTYGNMAGSK